MIRQDPASEVRVVRMKLGILRTDAILALLELIQCS